MTWLGWYLLGLITGVTLASLVVAAVGRVWPERGGTLTFDSPEARGVFKQRSEASPEPGGVRVWDPRDEWPLPLIRDESVPGGVVELRNQHGELIGEIRIPDGAA